MTEADPQTHSYFLSYSRSDERFALRLARDVRSQGIRMWVDQLDIRPSEHWDRAIERAVRDCRGIVVVLSPRSVASDNVADEISYAIESGKSVLPVMIERCVLPLRITRMHLIDATGNYDKALQQCLAALKDPAPDRTPGEQRKPETNAPLNPEVVHTAKRQLATILGPIAAIIVDKAAARASSATDLYALLLQHIDSEADRQRFLAIVPQTAAPSPPPRANTASGAISSTEIESIAGALTAYLGPIAPIVAKRESRACGSADELRQRLAALIPAEKDRAAFLSEAALR
jgi:TIR domain